MKALFIGAHQDDPELLGGGLATLYRENGVDVRFLSCCNGCGGHHIMTPAETTARRAKESARVSRMMDIPYDVWSDVDDCTIMPTLDMRRRMIRYIRAYHPDIIFTHRTNDYMADHRNVGLLVQDASYMLTVPHECPDSPAYQTMPVIMYLEDPFSYPPFVCDVVVDIDKTVDKKFEMAWNNDSQVFEWLPYNSAITMPPPAENVEERRAWFYGMNITKDTTDEEVLAFYENGGADPGAPTADYAPQFARPAVRFRQELIKRYGFERGSRVRYAEGFMVSEYGARLDEIKKKTFFPF